MSVDLLNDRPACPVGRDHPNGNVDASTTGPRLVGGLPSHAVLVDAPTTVEALLLSIGRGDQEAFLALQGRMAGLVRVNIRRILRDAARCETVTRETFAEVLEDAYHFDPHRDSAETWLLTRAHQHAMDGLGAIQGARDPERSGLDRSAVALQP